MDLTQRAKQIIEDNLYLTLSTCSQDTPWSTPLWYAVDDKYNFYFISDLASLHVLNIKQNSSVSFSIYNSQEKPDDVNGVQIKGTAHEIGITEIPQALTAIFKKAGSELFKLRLKEWNNPKTYTELTKFRIYKLTTNEVYILDTSVLETDKRIQVYLI